MSGAQDGVIASYIKQHFEIHVHVFSSVAGDYCIVFQRLDEDEKLPLDVDCRDRTGNSGDCLEMTVFVEVVEKRRSPKAILSRARLRGLRDCDNPIGLLGGALSLPSAIPPTVAQLLAVVTVELWPDGIRVNFDDDIPFDCEHFTAFVAPPPLLADHLFEIRKAQQKEAI